MNWRDIVELITIASAEDGVGGYITTETTRVVFANKKSIRSTEFYQANAVGLKPDISLVIRHIDYDGERKIKYSGHFYDVVRTYTKSEEIIELICAKRSEVSA